MHQEPEDLLGIAVTLEELAAFAAAVGAGERAAAQLGAATAIRDRVGAPVPAVDQGRRREQSPLLAISSVWSGTTSRIARVSGRSPMRRSRPPLQAVGGSLPQPVEARP